MMFEDAGPSSIQWAQLVIVSITLVVVAIRFWRGR
jgi:hypothetical protein